MTPESDAHIYFVVGSERSGSTLLRLMLGCHPEIAMVGQFEYAILSMDDDGTMPDPSVFATQLEVDRIFQASGLQIDPSLTARELVRDFLEQTRAAADARVTGGVVHYHFDRLLRIWPNARFVHLVRDGRDVARSTIGMGWDGDMWHASDRWLHAEQLWDSMAPSIPEDRRHELRYEDLVRAPEPTLRALTSFLGVNYSPAMLEYPDRSDYPAPDPARLDQWRRKLDEEELRLVESRAGEVLTARGYELSGGSVTPPTASQRRKLRLANRIFRIRHRVNQYGLALWTKEMVARRLGLDDRWRVYRRQMNEIEQAGLLRVPPAIDRHGTA